MSSCIKGLYDFFLFKKRRVCKNILLKSNFQKKTKMLVMDLIHNVNSVQKKTCLDNQVRKKEFYLDNRNRLLNKQKFYNKENSHRIKKISIEKS